MIFYKKIRFK